MIIWNKKLLVGHTEFICRSHSSLHLAPDRQPHQHPTTLFFTGRMPFLPPNQQHQSTQGKQKTDDNKNDI